MSLIRIILLILLASCSDMERPRASFTVFQETINPILSGRDFECVLSDAGLVNCKVRVAKTK